MTALQDLLDRASGEAIDVDVAADLRRGHRALTRRRQRVAAGVTGGLVAAGAADMPSFRAPTPPLLYDRRVPGPRHCRPPRLGSRSSSTSRNHRPGGTSWVRRRNTS